jgi:outer membrane protein OmpA-like peptidoglycan-associated protein
MLDFIKSKLPVAAVLFTVGALPAMACDSYNAVVDAVQSQDRAEATRLFDVIRADETCDDAIRDWTGVYLAREHFRDAMNEDLPLQERRAALRASLELETHWRTLAALGEIEMREGAFGPASTWFRQALREIAEGNQNHDATLDDIERVRSLYTDSLALTDDLMASAETDSELFRPSYRGFIVEETPLPITFEYDSTEFDEQGYVFAQSLLDHVLTHSPPRIELDGHTDPQGGETYNLDLSMARANAVRQHLIDGGYQGEILVRGFGESQVPEPPEGIAAGSEEHFRIARRVTFRSM